MVKRLTTGEIYRRERPLTEMTYEEAHRLLIQIQKIKKRGLAKKMCSRKTLKYLNTLGISAGLVKIYFEQRGEKEPDWFTWSLSKSLFQCRLTAIYRFKCSNVTVDENSLVFLKYMMKNIPRTIKNPLKSAAQD